jgi:hypothetical protein
MGVFVTWEKERFLIDNLKPSKLFSYIKMLKGRKQQNSVKVHKVKSWKWTLCISFANLIDHLIS